MNAPCGLFGFRLHTPRVPHTSRFILGKQLLNMCKGMYWSMLTSVRNPFISGFYAGVRIAKFLAGLLR